MRKVMTSQHGDWLEIESEQDFAEAQARSATGIGHLGRFYRDSGAEGLVWLILKPQNREEAVVAMAAWPEGADPSGFGLVPPGGYETGYANGCPHPDYTEDVIAVRDAMGLSGEPNYMGEPLSLEDAPMLSAA